MYGFEDGDGVDMSASSDLELDIEQGGFGLFGG